MIELDALTLHVRYTWRGRRIGDRMLDPATREVRLATAQGWYWSLLGLGLGWVQPGVAPLLRTSPPVLSDVQPRLMGDFVVPDEALGEDGSRPVWHRYPGGCLVDLEVAWEPRVSRRGRPVAWSALVGEGRAREADGRALLDLGPDLELQFTVGGVVFSSRLVGPAPAVEPGDVGRDDLVWLGVLSVVGALAAVLVAWALWTAGPRGVPSFSVEQVRGVILGR